MNLIAMALCAVCAQAVEFDYYENGDGTVTLSGVRGSVPADLVIPSEIEGRAVTEIGAKFCEECDSLRSVKFPDSIRAVADHGFDECNNLKSVDLNEGLLELGRRAFCECPIETLELPSTLESVGKGAFTRSNIPGPLFSKSISGLKSISIRYGDNSRFETCGGNGLYDKQEKRLILVSPYVTSFCVPDGCEFIGHTALLCCGNLTSITFPDSLTEIDDEAFASCVKLTTLDFSRTRLKRVSEQAFCGCIELISVSFPVTLVEIGGGAFCGANKLRTVRFLGNAPYVNVDYEETSGKWGDLYIAIRDFKSGDNWVYDGYIKTVSTYVEEGATGWGEVPGVWQGRPIRYVGTSPLDKPLELLPGGVASFDTELIGYTAKGLPSGLKYNKTTGMITGVATKPTAAEGVIVKFTKSGAETEEMTIVVGPMPKIGVALEGDADGCKVTGTGAYLVGKKVTLKVTTKKGTVFAGFYKDGEPWPNEASYKKTSLTYAMTKDDVALVARFKTEKISVGSEILTSGATFPAGVIGSFGHVALQIDVETSVTGTKVSGLPAGMKYDSKKKEITGFPSKAGDYTISVTVTTKSGATKVEKIPVTVAAVPVMATGTFSGFAMVGEDDVGTFALTATDAGKLTAKAVTAKGTYSFSKTGWDFVEEGVYSATLKTKKGDVLTLMLDSTLGWDRNQLWGSLTTAEIAATRKTAAVPSCSYDVFAQRHAFGKTWYFTATGDVDNGWTLAYTENAKTAALTVTLKADGSTAIAGTLPGLLDAKKAIRISASGYANVGVMTEGVIMADFAPIVTVNKVKRALSIHTNLWFDRADDHDEGAGGANFAE